MRKALSGTTQEEMCMIREHKFMLIQTWAFPPICSVPHNLGVCLPWILLSSGPSFCLFLPTAFSPNNDGTNDLFQIYTDKGVKTIHYLKIFDRWGECVYQYYNFNPFDRKIGWDGKYRGKFLNPAVFVYMTEIEFLNGEVRVYSGDIALLR